MRGEERTDERGGRTERGGGENRGERREQREEQDSERPGKQMVAASEHRRAFVEVVEGVGVSREKCLKRGHQDQCPRPCCGPRWLTSAYLRRRLETTVGCMPPPASGGRCARVAASEEQGARRGREECPRPLPRTCLSRRSEPTGKEPCGRDRWPSPSWTRRRSRSCPTSRGGAGA